MAEVPDSVLGGFDGIVKSLGTQLDKVTALIDEKTKSGDPMDIQDMFKVQMMMNTFSQMSEMTSGVFQALNGAKMSSARGIK